MTAEDSSIRVEREGRVALVVLDRPDRLNAIGTPMLSALDTIIAALAADGDVGAVVVAGEGKAFSAGADIAEMAGFDGPLDFSAFIEHMTDVYDRLERLPKPTAAAIAGISRGR